jgi:hypothetical protein
MHFENDYSGMPPGFQQMADSFWVKLNEASRQERALVSPPNTTPLHMGSRQMIARFDVPGSGHFAEHDTTQYVHLTK